MNKNIYLNVVGNHKNDTIEFEIKIKNNAPNKELELYSLIDWDYEIKNNCVEIEMCLLYKKRNSDVFYETNYKTNYEYEKIILPEIVSGVNVLMYDVISLSLKRKNINN